MAKKKQSHSVKKPKEQHQGNDTAVQQKTSTANSGKRKNRSVPSTSSSTSTTASSYLLLIGLSVTIATVAIVYNNEDLQLHLVKLTNFDTSPSSAQSVNIPTESSTETENIPHRETVADVNDSDQKLTSDTVDKSSETAGASGNVDTAGSVNDEKIAEAKSDINGDTIRESDSIKTTAEQVKASAEESSDKSAIKIEKPSQSIKVDKKVQDESVEVDKKVQDESVEVDKMVQDESVEVDKKVKDESVEVDKKVKDESVEVDKKVKDESVESVKDKKPEKKKSKRKDYVKYSITSREDYKIRKKLDAADQLREESNLAGALDKYDRILADNPYSPRALWGKAQVLDVLAERQRSNAKLEEAMVEMSRVLRLSNTPPDLLVLVGTKLAERQEFRGWDGKAASTWAHLADRFPAQTEYRNKQGVSYLRSGQNERAREVFKQVLERDPDDGMALVHLGFILKVVDLDYKEGTVQLQRGIDTGQPGTNEGKFYYHLGDAYIRLNQSEKAAEVYKRGADQGLFLSQYQRSLYNAETPLTGRPWWNPEQTTYKHHITLLEKNWKTIREEGLSQLDLKTGSFLPEEEHLRETGDWKQFTLYQRGIKNKENCQKVPKTCALIDQIPDAKGCKRGQVKFSVMHPGVHVWPHTGPTNCRLRAHLGLVVPEGPRIRVVNDTRTWTEGKVIIFDDSFEHEVWHDGKELRLVLIVDFWHPDLTTGQKQMLSPI